LPGRRFESKLCRHRKPETAIAASARNVWVLTVISIVLVVLPESTIDETSAGGKAPNEKSTIKLQTD
jgi:hypothetical protein